MWGHCGTTLGNKLQILQDSAARILAFSSYNFSSGPLFEQLGWKMLDTQSQIQEAVMVYKSLHGLTPNCLCSLFTQRYISYNLRDNENKLVIPLPRTNFLKNSFRYNGAVIWNNLPPELRQAETINSFRRGCHNFLLDHYLYTAFL